MLIGLNNPNSNDLRHDGPTPDEARQMGLEIAIKIYQTREPMLRSRSVYDAASAVERQFKDELGPLPDGMAPSESRPLVPPTLGDIF